MVVHNSLAVESKEAIHSLLERLTFRPRSAESPFAEATANVARLAEQLRQRDGVGWNRILTLRWSAAVVADEGVSRVLASHQHAAGRSTDRVAGIMLRQPHPFGSEFVQMRRLDFRLSKAADLTVAEIVCQDENDVGTTWFGTGGSVQPQSTQRKGGNESKGHGAYLLKGPGLLRAAQLIDRSPAINPLSIGSSKFNSSKKSAEEQRPRGVTLSEFAAGENGLQSLPTEARSFRWLHRSAGFHRPLSRSTGR